MKLGIMQPYFLPYIGYWQLLNAVDKYVIYDDVNFIKGGWINRNRILNNGMVQYFNVPMLGAGSYKNINQIGVNNSDILIKKNKKTLWNAYHRTEMFAQVYPVICDILECRRENLAEFLEFSIEAICQYLEIDTELYVSSKLHKNNELHGEDKVIDICRNMGADVYYNAIGGKELYHYERFKENGIELCFLNTVEVVYRQGAEERFEHNLSIVDVMMNNDIGRIKEMLQSYTLFEQ